MRATPTLRQMSLVGGLYMNGLEGDLEHFPGQYIRMDNLT